MSLDNMTIAKRYSKAFFDLVSEQDQLEDSFAELTELRTVFSTDDDLGAILSDARLTLIEKRQLVKTLTDAASPLVANLIQMVFDYGRMASMVAIVDEFERLYDEKKHLVHAKVTTAIDIDDEQRDRLADAFAQRIGADKVNVTAVTDPSILGGVIVQSNDQILDGSLSSKIMKIKRLLVK